MSNTVITNYTDLNGPSSKADSSVVVIVNKDGSLSVDQNCLGTLMGSDGSQSAGISVVRVGHEGRPDDATDSENEDDKIPHVTLTVDSYYDEPNSIIKYDSGAEMLQSLRIETRENSLIGFQNDHCYTPLTSPSQEPQRSENIAQFDEPVIEITHTPPPKPVPSSKKITILEQQIIPKGKKLHINPPDSSIILKTNDVLKKPLPVLTKCKEVKDTNKLKKNEASKASEESAESRSSSGDSIPDRDSDSDYRDRKEPVSVKLRKLKTKPPRILARATKVDPKSITRVKGTKNVTKRSNVVVPVKENKNQHKAMNKDDSEIDLETLLPTTKIAVSGSGPPVPEVKKTVLKSNSKLVKKEKKTPAHVTALLSDMTSLFSTPDVIRRVSTDAKIGSKTEKEFLPSDNVPDIPKVQDVSDSKTDTSKLYTPMQQTKNVLKNTDSKKDRTTPLIDKTSKAFDLIPQLDDASLAQIFQETSSNSLKHQNPLTTAPSLSSPGLSGPLSPTLDLLAGLQPEEEGLSEDLLMHVAQLVESSANLQEVIDKQVLGKVDVVTSKPAPISPFQQASASNLYAQTSKTVLKAGHSQNEPTKIVRRDGRVITLPPIEAPATRSSKRKSQIESVSNIPEPPPPVVSTPPPPVTAKLEPQLQQASVSKNLYMNKKLTNKKPVDMAETPPPPVLEKVTAESQESWNSEDDPNRLWCICKQPHNNRFMICCDGCEDWFHGKCVNITKAMGQQMEEQGIEWRCPNCIKKTKGTAPKSSKKKLCKPEMLVEAVTTPSPAGTSKTGCIVCKKSARASSIYCSDACILKHAQDSLGTQASPDKAEIDSAKPQEKQKSESRVIVYERKSGRLLAGPNAPTAENLKTWLQKNPTFEVVRPGTLSTIKPNSAKKKPTSEPHKIQTTLNFERIPRKSQEATTPVRAQPEGREKRALPSPREEVKPATVKTPMSTRSQPLQIIETPKASTSTAKPASEPRKLVRSASNRSHSSDKTPSASGPTTRRKDSVTYESKNKMNAPESDIRENVRKSLQEQLSQRMAETKGPKFTEEESRQFAVATELELHELFRDVGLKYKAKYRSLMFNIKDRKNLTLWHKICDKSITPKQLVRLSPEELASQELAEWRDQEAKHQLELIKKSELDLLAANKTYVLKTHKGEEVMETKESVSTELDPNVPIEDVVTALNDSTVGEEVTREIAAEENKSKAEDKKQSSSRKRERDTSSNRSKKSRRDSKRSSRSDRSSRSSRRKLELKEKETREERRRSSRRTERRRSSSRDRTKRDFKEKSNSSERSRHRSHSKDKSKKRSKSRSTSKGRDTSRSRARSPLRSPARSHARSRRRTASEEYPKRSRSQDNYKVKADSTDSDSADRPKSAMQKEPHPEYDPHEAMITSAISEEDLRKSEDGYEDSYKKDIPDTIPEYDPTKSFNLDSTLDTNVILPTTTYSEESKPIETESDQEPSSTVDNAAATVWNGCINMVDVARFYVAAHEVSGSAVDIEEDLCSELDIVGRIKPETVWDYIAKTKKQNNKDIILLRLQAANDEEKMQYIALYSYLSSRNRLGVVKVPNSMLVKDFYIVPLAAHSALAPELLPLEGPGLGDTRTHLLIAILVRPKRKRLSHMPHDIIPAKVARESRKRSYTPPPVAAAGKASYTPPASPRRRALPLPSYTSTALSSSVKDKIAASLARADDEAYSPGSTGSSGGGGMATIAPAPAIIPPPATSLRTKMEELNRQIEEQKQQILKMAQADSSICAEDEAYSPSRPMTPPSVVAPTLADISLPSNLQEILATIKQRTENATTDIDMRSIPLP